MKPFKKMTAKPDLRWHDDGQSWLCMTCGEVVPRTRSNPFPEHQCKPAARQIERKPEKATQSPYDLNGLKEYPGE